jgi:hypothetical protein
VNSDKRILSDIFQYGKRFFFWYLPATGFLRKLLVEKSSKESAHFEKSEKKALPARYQ